MIRLGNGNKGQVLRLLATNDFFGHYSPERTSYGALPGGEGLRRTVEELREGKPTLWADAGDFSGGPLAAVTGGTLGFEAVSELGIDVAAAGNHEFDWGATHLAEQAPKLGLPLLCANADVGLPGTAVIETGAGEAGFVGITIPGADLAPQFGPETDPVAHENKKAQTGAGITDVVTESSRRLRNEGADFVIALLHDGVYVTGSPSEGFALDPGPFVELCKPWAKEVDAIVAGHTIVARWFGSVEGTPVMQPWPFGAEVGVLELSRDRQTHAYGVPVEPAGPWSGRGTEVLGRLETDVAGYLDRPLRFPNFGAQKSGYGDLLEFAARALRSATGAGASMVMAWTGGINSTQPAVEGVEAFLAAGPVTEADLLRLVPWPDDAVVLVEIDPEEIERLQASGPIPWRAAVDIGEMVRIRNTVTVAMTAYAARACEGWFGRSLNAEDTGCGLRNALRKALGRDRSLEKIRKVAR